MNFTQQFKNAARVSTPLVAVRTFDAKSTVDGIRKLKCCDFLILWDAVHGARGLDESSNGALATALNGQPQESTVPFVEALRTAERLPENSMLFASNAHLFWEASPDAIQAVWNLRDVFKGNGSMLVLLIAPGTNMPKELQHDVMVLDEPLPTEAELNDIIAATYEAAKKKKPSIKLPAPETLKKAIDAMIGLPAFPADQSTAMCLDTNTGELDIAELWTRKKQIISQIPGLTFCTSKTFFKDLGGAENWKAFMRARMTGKEAPSLILRMDEIEKLFAGTGTDTSGTKTELTGAFLTWTSERHIEGTISVGLPGSGKTESIFALGNEFAVPVIDFNIGAMQDKFVGNSGANFRAATAAIDAISAGHIMIIATSNGLGSLPPELRSRFKLGIFFWDAPEAAERRTIWQIYQKRYNLPLDEKLPNDTGWTGREIEECCRKAYLLNLTLDQSARYIVPVTKFAHDEMENLRLGASGKYISAAHDGAYKYHEFTEQLQAVAESTGRKLK